MKKFRFSELKNEINNYLEIETNNLIEARKTAKAIDLYRLSEIEEKIEHLEQFLAVVDELWEAFVRLEDFLNDRKSNAI